MTVTKIVVASCEQRWQSLIVSSSLGSPCIQSFVTGDEIICDLRLIEVDTALIILLVLWCDMVYARFIFISGGCSYFDEIRLLIGKATCHNTIVNWFVVSPPLIDKCAGRY